MSTGPSDAVVAAVRGAPKEAILGGAPAPMDPVDVILQRYADSIAVRYGRKPAPLPQLPILVTPENAHKFRPTPKRRRKHVVHTHGNVVAIADRRMGAGKIGGT